MFFYICKFLAWLPLVMLFPTRMKGKKNLPKGKAIISCNHKSNMDIVNYLLHTPKKIKILAKKEIFKNKLFGAVMKSYGGIPIDRDSNDINAIKECMKALKAGKQLFVFPEGTRLKDESKVLGELKSGMAMIAVKTKTPIVPVWVEKKARIFRRNTYRIGEAFELSDFYGKKLDEETLAQANEVVKQKMLALYEEGVSEKEAKMKKKNKNRKTQKEG
ncbi:MAG: 1-acyl-sn-glycerol-3-phosphate acyltransferase [Clostridia bacterium]|nr:1-acyl-sn-glycerol-3-phosphate acyltransferase [Clostridia bacterium]